MSTDNFKRIDINVLYPNFRRLIEKLVENCRARGVEYYATSGLRTWDEQSKLYALGRTVPNVDATPEKPMGGIVTQAKAGQSYHSYGIAVDFCPDKDKTRAGLQPDWNRASYQILAEEATKLGLEAGYYWKFVDNPHVQLKISKNGLTLFDLQKAYGNGGPKAVEALLNKFSW